jgi:hypothetical protein
MKRIFLLVILGVASVGFVRAQTVTISGVIKTSDGDLLHYAFVQDKQDNIGVYTDSLGYFSISANRNAMLHITCLGYKDTLFKWNGVTPLTIILKPSVIITASNNNNADAGTTQVNKLTLNDRIMYNTPVSGTTNQGPYARAGGATVAKVVTPAGTVPIAPSRIPGGYSNGFFDGIAAVMGTTAPNPQGNNAITQGDAIATFRQKEETQGSRIFFKNFVHGYVITSEDSLIEDPTFLLDYDKIGGKLLLTKNRVTVIEVDADKVKSFTLFDELNQPYIFTMENDIDRKHFVQVIADGPVYKIYKKIKTKFVASNYVSDGVASSGNDYDEYEDEFIYYLLNVKTGKLQPIGLKKKVLKQAFAADEAKADGYFKTNDGDIDDNYLVALGDYMNK